MTLATQLAKIPHVSTCEAITEILSGAGYLLTADITGYPTKAKTGTAVNAVAASGTVTINGVVIDGETITIGSNVYEFDTNNSVTGSNIRVNIAASAVVATGTLTITGVAIDTETVTIGSEVYEFDWNGAVTGGRIAANISSYVDQAKGTLTLTGAVAHGELFATGATTWTFKADGTAGGTGVINITAYAVKGTAVLSLGGSVTDTETVTINSRVYEFDTNAAITGDVLVDVSGGATKDLAGVALAAAITADASAVVTAVYDSGTNELTVTAKIGGTVGNYTTASATALASWSGNLTGGTNCSAANAKVAILADHSQANVSVAAGAGTTAVFSAYGTAGDALTFTKTIANGSVDGAGTLGGTQAGTDCTAPNAVLALVAAITASSTLVTAVDGAADTVVVTAKVPGAAGNVASTQTCANATWGAVNLASGADCSKGNAQTAIRSIVNSTETSWQLAAFGGDAAVLTAQTKGVLLNSVATVKTGTNISWAAVASSGGLDGTVGAQWSVLVDASYIYVAVAANTTAGTNWKRAAIGTF